MPYGMGAMGVQGRMPRVLVRGSGEALSYVFAHLFAAFLLLKRGVSVVVLFLV